MTTQNPSSAGNLDSVITHPAHPSLNEETKNRFASRVLELTGVLQTTLETHELLAIFAKEIERFVPYDGLNYQFPGLRLDVSIGKQALHSCAYQLVIIDEHLGDLKFSRDFPFEEEELENIEGLIAGLLYPLRNSLLYQRAVDSASTDPLTGVKNRAAMNGAMKREIGLAQRHQSPFSCIILDIDHFKRVNDTHGHLYGDQALRSIAECTEQTIRESDMVFRYGGEEFVIVLTDTDTEGAELLAERIRVNVSRLDPVPGKKLKLTVSLGVTMLRSEDDGNQFFERLDKALYQAKNSGRNRVVVD
ncbi:MAG: GGDEF domain-containing protein [Candidatus Sedimenticola sp. (ex Thyasira tokunagai)]